MKDGLRKIEGAKHSSMSFGGGKHWRLFTFSCGKKTDRNTGQILRDVTVLSNNKGDLKLPLEYML